MIELVSQKRCISCNLCVSVCPTEVFDKGEDGIPLISRKEDCQTCFMCEAYCPVDALYVSPHPEEEVIVEETVIIENGLLGSYRKELGWGKGRKASAEKDASGHVFNAMKNITKH
ncbi:MULTISPECIES: ferredoxin family protein [Bacillaceae]|uniref:4Fe-4S ferredoxin n=1 Tax=Domibacillus aminovorans TaxID=29332 RepID=A0A177KUS6_9BACI|nr:MULTISPECIES: ferredoxin family protein [Bacillaceae]OAH57100.1 4Fe-4S ferredoxin [Domibacillus aminovorans]